MFFSSYRSLIAVFGVFGCFCLFKPVFWGAEGYGKSPWFLSLHFFQLLNQGWLRLKLGVVDGAEFLY